MAESTTSAVPLELTGRRRSGAIRRQSGHFRSDRPGSLFRHDRVTLFGRRRVFVAGILQLALLMDGLRRNNLWLNLRRPRMTDWKYAWWPEPSTTWTIRARSPPSELLSPVNRLP